jgi:hypothetical protein
MLIWFIRNPRRATKPIAFRDRKVGWVLPAVLAALILYPLGIPTSWTQKNIVEKRLETKETAIE